MPKGKRGLTFTARELENLADTVEEIVPISHTEWDRVRDQHSEFFPEQNRTTESLRRKFQWMVKMKIPTGDPNMPRHIRVAKRANYAIVKATDGSTGSPVTDLADDDEDEGEGVVHANVGQNVTRAGPSFSFFCTKSNIRRSRDVTRREPQHHTNRQNRQKHRHHGGRAALLSSDVESMDQRDRTCGRPVHGVGRGRGQSS